MSCNHTVASHHVYCSVCGEKQERKICQCSAANVVDANYCNYCGCYLLGAAQDERSRKIGPTDYDLNALYNAVKSDSNLRCAVKSKRIKQSEIDDIFNRK